MVVATLDVFVIVVVVVVVVVDVVVVVVVVVVAVKQLKRFQEIRYPAGFEKPSGHQMF